MSRQRQTMVFFLPMNMEAFVGNTTPYSAGGPKPPSYDAEGNIVKGDDRVFALASGGQSVTWDRRQLYMNPQTFTIRDQKLVQKSLTKGGFAVQYWGEELPVIDVQGTTGSAGVEGINILRDIYRHEQLHYRTVLADRQREIAQAAAAARREAEEESYDSGFGGFLMGAGDLLTGGALSKTKDGVANSVDILFGSDIGSDYGGKGGSFKSVPTLAAFATNIDMYYQGEFYRGYFTSFSTTESASEPGHFTYNFNFVVTRRSGKRENFMPWHRNPRSFDGDTVMSQSTTTEKGSWPGVEMLSFPPSDSWVSGNTRAEGLNTAGNPELGPGSVRSEFTDDMSAVNPEHQEQNKQIMDRRGALKDER
jgi:hypothetical protein